MSNFSVMPTQNSLNSVNSVYTDEYPLPWEIQTINNPAINININTSLGQIFNINLSLGGFVTVTYNCVFTDVSESVTVFHLLVHNPNLAHAITFTTNFGNNCYGESFLLPNNGYTTLSFARVSTSLLAQVSRSTVLLNH